VRLAEVESEFRQTAGALLALRFYPDRGNSSPDLISHDFSGGFPQLIGRFFLLVFCYSEPSVK
jgi:hypothetical protein